MGLAKSDDRGKRLKENDMAARPITKERFAALARTLGLELSMAQVDDLYPAYLCLVAMRERIRAADEQAFTLEPAIIFESRHSP
jgi:hypothetical protein